MQCRPAVAHVAVGIGLLIDADVPRGFGGQQVVLEGAVIATARHPDVASSQTVAQRGKHRGLVQAPVRRAVREDQLAPFRRQEGRRRALGQGARTVAVHSSEDLDRSQDRVLRRARLKAECG